MLCDGASTNAPVVLAEAKTHYHRAEFGEDWSFGTATDRNR